MKIWKFLAVILSFFVFLDLSNNVKKAVTNAKNVVKKTANTIKSVFSYFLG
jgi:hypothetical protein